MTARRAAGLVALAALLAGLVLVPLRAGDYVVGLGISVLSYTALATAWALFSGPTRYISLATVAFFGIGAYTVAVANDAMAWPLVVLVVVGVAAALSALVGLSTLRLSGVYFVIFTFGLAELIRQVVTWYEVNVSRSLGRYIFTDITSRGIYLQLLVLTGLIFVAGWAIGRSRLGLALRMIGDDEPVARHMGVDTTWVKLSVFVLSSVAMGVTGAIVAPRWVYLDPVIAFKPTLSFLVVIMALLGGAGRLFGPALGAVPLVLLFEALTARFPNRFTIVLGVVFVVIVYFLPDGVLGRIERARRRGRRGREATGRAGAGGTPGGAAAGDGGRVEGERGEGERAEGRRPPGTKTLTETLLAGGGVRAPASGPPLLKVRELHKAFGGLQAVFDLSLQVAPGEILGLIGPNGSGKTTVLNLISGALRPDEGAIELRGEAIAGLRPERVARLGVARTFQLVRVFPSLSCAENVVAGLAFRRERRTGAAAREQADELLARVGLKGKGATPASELTYIDQKRLELARALALDPELLLLDEWLAGLNPSELEIGIDLIRGLQLQGITTVMVEHVMDAIRSLCDRVVVMSTGSVIAEGTPADVLADPEVVRAYLGTADG